MRPNLFAPVSFKRALIGSIVLGQLLGLYLVVKL